MITLNSQPIALEIPASRAFLDQWFRQRLQWMKSSAKLMEDRSKCSDLEISYQEPSWHECPELELNQWYYPTGASRWGYGFFLMDKATYDLVVPGGSERSAFSLAYGSITFAN